MCCAKLCRLHVDGVSRSIKYKGFCLHYLHVWSRILKVLREDNSEARVPQCNHTPREMSDYTAKQLRCVTFPSSPQWICFLKCILTPYLRKNCIHIGQSSLINNSCSCCTMSQGCMRSYVDKCTWLQPIRPVRHPVARRFLVQQLLCSWFQTAKASDIQEPLLICTGMCMFS